MDKAKMTLIITQIAPKELAKSICRCECYDAKRYYEKTNDKTQLLMYRKGAKSMLDSFCNDASFVEAVVNEWDYLMGLDYPLE